MPVDETNREMRERAGLTQVDVASRAPLSMGAVVRLEAGGNVDSATIAKYAKAIGRSVPDVADAHARAADRRRRKARSA